ncbi:MAG TPA: hypothetical protein VF789_09300 [Thermoanaerobaculia bacterium]
MSSQHVCLHRAVRVLTALVFGFLLALPPASAAASRTPAFRFQIEILADGPPGSTETGPFIDKDVDPWDDDLDGRRPPPPPPPPTTTFGSELSGLGEQEGSSDTAVVTIDAVSDSVLQLVLRDRDGLAVAMTSGKSVGMPLRLTHALAEGRYFLEVESLNGDATVYVLTLHRSSWP